MAHPNDERRDVEAERVDLGSSADRLIGAIVGGSYRLTRRIGSGSSSHVFEVEHLRLGKSFALKLLRPDVDPNRRTAQRFRREARAVARLKSEHIVSVIDCGELDDGTPYLVMELLEGEDLRNLLNREGTLPARRAVPLIIEACRGLSEVHAAGLIHRDLKPENLFITKRNTGQDWCKVLDFGVAKMEASMSTAQGAIVGTLRYMAPEQLDPGHAIGPTTDVYALGAIIYECLCGDPAQPGDTTQEVMYSVMNRTVSKAPLHAANVPAALVSVVMSCLAKKQQLRPCDTGELAARLSQSMASVPSALSFPTLAEDEHVVRSQPSKRSFRRRLRWAAGVSVVGLGVAALVGWFRAVPLPRNAPLKVATGSSRAATPAAAARIPAALPPAVATSAPSRVAATTSPVGAVGPSSGGNAAPRSKRTRGNPSPSAQPANVAVGRFDPANPYDK